MRKVLLAISIFLILSNFNPAFGGIIFYDDCEDAPKRSEWKTNGDGQYGKSFSVSSEQARAGKKSYKYVLPALGDGQDKHIGSIPLKPTRHFAFNKEFWIGFSIYIPRNFDFPSEGNNWVLGPQFHGSPDNLGVCDSWRNPNFAMFPKDDNQSFEVAILGQKAKCSLKTYGSAKTYERNKRYSLSTPLKKGSWNDIVLNFKFNYSNGGFMKVWMNGKKVVDDVGINSFNDDVAPFFYIGLYGKVDKKTTVYYDEFRIGDSKSSFNQISPGKATGALPDTPPDQEELVPPTLQILTNS